MASFAPSYADTSVSSRYSTATTSTTRTRDYYQPAPGPRKVSNPNEVIPTRNYMERGQRWMEKEEVVSLRDAMDEMNLREHPEQAAADDRRLYDAALDEAAELVWQHQNGYMPPPRPEGAYRYRPHLRKNSYAYARAASVGEHADEMAPTGMGRDIGYRSASGSSQSSDGYIQDSRMSSESGRPSATVTSRKSYGSMGSHMHQQQRRTSRRNISGEVVTVPFTGDQIWEEPSHSPERSAAPGPAMHPLSNKYHTNQSALPMMTTKPLDRVEIHRNPPTRSRNPLYTTNGYDASRATPDPNVETRDGVELRSQDIRDATSMRMKDRSAKLPEPTAVSDRPGRPIVSFDKNWRAPEEQTAPSVPSIVLPNEPPSRQQPSIPTISVSVDDVQPAPGVPSINVPSIAVDESSVPSISVSVDDGSSSSQKSTSRRLPSRSKPRAPFRPSGHVSLGPAAGGRTRTLCHECGFPIEGRFVSLAGISERFHPACFSCYCCGTSLEAMEISPEPESVRTARVERIHRREAGEDVPDEEGATAEEDGDERMRFYCHLDWHESFAPRCKHCKTPILGEHVVALGEHWHNGHFFCAECGDPFSHGMTHIEKDGYAWCINCQTKRTERRAPKCRACKQAVIGQYIEALGAEWHEHCFRCADCQGGFADGQIFVREGGNGGVVVCTPCRVKELKL